MGYSTHYCKYCHARDPKSCEVCNRCISGNAPECENFDGMCKSCRESADHDDYKRRQGNDDDSSQNDRSDDSYGHDHDDDSGHDDDDDSGDDD